MELKRALIIAISIILLILIILTINYYSKSISYSEGTCTTLEQNGNPESNVDIVFITSDLNENEVKKYVTYFKNTKPFDESSNKFNFYWVNEKPECEITNSAILCYSKKLLNIADTCPNDFIIAIQTLPPAIRSSAYINVISMNSNHNTNVIMHEFGHVFGTLADEYVPANLPKKSKNCASSEIFEQNFLGCSKENYYRSSPASLMRTLSSSSYDSLNEKLLKQKIQEF